MTRDDLESMTKDELREHAEVQGVKLHSLDSKGAIIEKILGEWKPEPKKKQDGKDIPLGALYDLNGKKIEAPLYKVTIFSTEQDKNDVDLIVNGHNVRVKRNQEVLLMEPYVEVLRNAVVMTIVQDPDTGIKTPTQMMQYPHTAIAV